MLSDQALIDAIEIFEENQQLVDVLEAAETQRFATVGNAYHDTRERQREWQRNLIHQQGGDINPNQPGRFEFQLRPISHDTNRRYGLEERRYQVNLRQEGNIIDHIAPALRDGLHRSINQLLDQGNIPNSHCVYFDMFLERLRDTFRLEVTTVAPRTVRGTGKPRRKKMGYLGAEEFLLKNRSIIKIVNPNDNLCAARAIVAAKATVDLPFNHGVRRQLTKTHKGTSDRPQLQAAYRLTGVPEETAVGPEELKKFQAVLSDHRLICVYTGRANDAVAFTPYDPKKKDIIIVHMDHHYHACSSLNGFHQTSYYCKYCLKGYDN